MNRSNRIQSSQPTHRELQPARTFMPLMKDEQRRNEEIVLHADITSSASIDVFKKHCKDCRTSDWPKLRETS